MEGKEIPEVEKICRNCDDYGDTTCICFRKMKRMAGKDTCPDFSVRIKTLASKEGEHDEGNSL